MKFFLFGQKKEPHLTRNAASLSYMHELTPSVVAMAVMTLTMICRISFQVSLFIFLSDK